VLIDPPQFRLPASHPLRSRLASLPMKTVRSVLYSLRTQNFAGSIQPFRPKTCPGKRTKGVEGRNGWKCLTLCSQQLTGAPSYTPCGSACRMGNHERVPVSAFPLSISRQVKERRRCPQPPRCLTLSRRLTCGSASRVGHHEHVSVSLRSRFRTTSSGTKP
jgi:hypothetical protein